LRKRVPFQSLSLGGKERQQKWFHEGLCINMGSSRENRMLFDSINERRKQGEK